MNRRSHLDGDRARRRTSGDGNWLSVRARRMNPVVSNAGQWCVALLLILPSWGAGSELGPVPFDEPAFHRFMADHLKKTGIPGISVAITSGNSVTMIKGYGQDGHGFPMTEHTPIFIASLSKSITAVAVLQLVERGRLSLDTPVHEYLPEFQLADSRYLQITTRHLLNQSSGMSDRTYFEWSLPGPRSLTEVMQLLRAATLAAPPGDEFNYHNRNYDVAARLVEAVSGENFSSYLREHVFKPLGMHDAKLVERMDDPGSEVPPGHVYAFGRAIATSGPSFFLSGSGGVVASASDMAQWLLFNSGSGMTAAGVRILSDANMDLMHRASAPDGRYAFGWIDRSSRQPSSFLHDGWLPTFTAFQSLSLDGRHNMAILSNGARTFLNGSDAGYVSRRVQAIESGRAPQSFGESTRTLDLALTGGTLLVMAAALRAFWCARRWAERARRTQWRVVLGLGPSVMALSLIVVIPKFVWGVLGGRGTSWSVVTEPGAWVWLFYISPVGVMCCAAVGLSCVAVLFVRTSALMQVSRRPSWRGTC
jgi:CubicO group peptidase (beta-lactamase class C family)